MGKLYNLNGIRVWYYSGDRDERRHVHVSSGDGLGKIWLDDLSWHWQQRLKAQEVSAINELLKEKQHEFLAQINRNFSK